MNAEWMLERARAEKIRDQVLKTWNPPSKHGEESEADIAQTATMISLAYIFGRDFLGVLSINQSRAVDSGLRVFRDLFDNRTLCRNCGDPFHKGHISCARCGALKG